MCDIGLFRLNNGVALFAAGREEGRSRGQSNPAIMTRESAPEFCTENSLIFQGVGLRAKLLNFALSAWPLENVERADT
jgi:hypothetical protein